MSIDERYVDGTHVRVNPEWGEDKAAWKAANVLGIIADNDIDYATMCDVGCGTGGVLDAIARQRPRATYVGYELSADALSLAPPDRTERIELRNASAFDDDQHFDVLLMLDVFEHVDDYLGFLRRARQKADHAVFHIPLDISVQSVLRGRSLMASRETVGHLHYFTAETACATVRDAGYTIVDHRFTTPTLDGVASGRRESLARLPRRVLHRRDPALAARLLGGFPLLVLARADAPTT